MPELVVDLLEPIQIEHDERERQPGAPRTRKLGLEHLQHVRAVRATGQRVADAVLAHLAEQRPGIVSEYRAVVVGCGPVGRTLSRLLREGGIEPVIIEMNLENSRRVRDEGYRPVYGDATQPEVLEAAGIRTAIAVIVVGPPSDQGAEIVRIARTLNPQVRVLARSYYLRETDVMRRAGADEVFSGEGEVALAMTEYILGILGATPEQMDRERQRVREDVFRISRGAR